MERSLVNELDPYWQWQCLLLLAPPREFNNVVRLSARKGFRAAAILRTANRERRTFHIGF
jgi:hypothetical protein